eukprot:14384115-Alexandrium_andersonii.AAC.1
MSASLVGSEMCIRDRSKRALAGPPGGPLVPEGRPPSEAETGCQHSLYPCLLYTSDAADDM